MEDLKHVLNELIFWTRECLIKRKSRYVQIYLQPNVERVIFRRPVQFTNVVCAQRAVQVLSRIRQCVEN